MRQDITVIADLPTRFEGFDTLVNMSTLVKIEIVQKCLIEALIILLSFLLEAQ